MKYSVVLRGENFELSTDEGVKNFGFFTARRVKANNINEAEMLAIELVKSDYYLRSNTAKESTYEPRIYIEAMYKAKWWQRLGGKGFTFFLMDEGDA